MKKIISLVAAAVLSTAAVFADGNEHTLGLGITFPVSSLSIKGSDDDVDLDESFSHTGFGVDLTYLFINDSGFSGKADLTLEKISASGFDENPDWNWNFSMDLGIGYTFLKNESFSLSALGIIGFNFGCDSWEENHWTEALLLKTFDFGVDVIGKYKFTSHIGAFANLGLRYAIDMGSKYEVEFDKHVNEDDFSIDIKTTGFRFVPTFGVSWTF